MASQTKNGKAFEYACAKVLIESLAQNQEVVLDETTAFITARNFYVSSESDVKNKMDLAARAAVKMVLKMEPVLKHPQDDSPLYLSIQEDARGIAGDVRDVVCIRRKSGWELGFSCKHNHFAVKHSRLSQTIDFGNQWFATPCSQNYFADIKPLFSALLEMKRRNVLWKDIDDKEDRFYVPLLTSFVSELNRLDQLYTNEIPGRLITYLLGRNDFYKIIAEDGIRMTNVQPFNIFGTLNKPSGTIEPQGRIPKIRLPRRFFDISFKENSKNTVVVSCDQGWAVSFRIHNASSKVEPSLKFDVNLEGTPNLGSMIQPWEEEVVV